MATNSTHDQHILTVFSCIIFVAKYTTSKIVAQVLIMIVVGIGLLYLQKMQGNLPIPAIVLFLLYMMLIYSMPTDKAMDLATDDITGVTDRLCVRQSDRPSATKSAATILEQLPVGLLLLGGKAEILFCNATSAKLLQRTEEELLGNTAFGSSWQVVQTDGTTFADATVLLSPQENLVLGLSEPQNKTCIWLLVNTQPYKVDNSLIQVICTINDITEIQKAKFTLLQSQSCLEKQNNVLLALAKSKTLTQGDLNQALKEITEAAASTLLVERVSVWQYNSNRSKIYCLNLYEKTHSRHTLGMELAAEDYPVYFKALEASRTIASHDAYTDTRTSEFGRSYFPMLGITSMLDAPIWLKGEMVGVVCNEHIGSQRQWTIEEQNFAGCIADLVTLAMEASQRQRSITERKRVEEALSQAKDELEIQVTKRTVALQQANSQLIVEITERSAAQRALQSSESQYKQLAQREELLNRLATQIRNSLNLDTILETTVHTIRELLQIDRCAFAWYRPERREGEGGKGRGGERERIWHVVKEARKEGLEDLSGEYPASTVGPLAQNLLNLEVVRVDNVNNLNEPKLQQLLNDLGTQSLLALPLQNRSGEIGILVLSHCSEPRHWLESEVELITSACVQLAIAIDQAHLYAQAQEAAQIAQARSYQLQQALEKLTKAQAQLVQSEKMSSLGQLVAGIAHEINNPANFIYGNLVHAQRYIQDLLNILHLYEKHYPQPAPPIQKLGEEIDLDFVVADLPKLLSSMQLGVQRISQIVLSLRNFSRLDEAEMKSVNLHEGIENTLLILQHRLKSTGHQADIQIIKEYGELPSVECYPGRLNQVFMNILNNAIDAIEGKMGNASNGRSQDRPYPTPYIRIRTESSPNNVRIRISDNGPGMSENVKARIFDPFFTTKPVGSGTGLGLSISYQIIAENHKGVLSCSSELGQGAEFCIEIPICQTNLCFSKNSNILVTQQIRRDTNCHNN